MFVNSIGSSQDGYLRRAKRSVKLFWKRKNITKSINIFQSNLLLLKINFVFLNIIENIKSVFIHLHPAVLNNTRTMVVGFFVCRSVKHETRQLCEPLIHGNVT